MAKRIALLHTVKGVYNDFPEQLTQAIPEIELDIFNTLDDFLAIDANRNGFDKNNLNRLYLLLKTMELSEVDLLLTTCSTLTPGVDKIRPFIQTPLVAIDDALVEKGIHMGKKILVLATAESAIGPVTQKMRSEAAQENLPTEIIPTVYFDAFKAMQQGDMQKHDQIVMSKVGEIKDVDGIVLAQASTAHLESDIEQATGIKTISSPKLCFDKVRSIMQRT